MANVIIPNNERKEAMERVAQSYGVQHGDRAAMEACEIIAAKSLEAQEMARREERR